MECHLRVDNGIVYAGTVNEKGEWSNLTEVTAEAAVAIREHLLYQSHKNKHDMAFSWNYEENNKILMLKLEEFDAP